MYLQIFVWILYLQIFGGGLEAEGSPLDIPGHVNEELFPQPANDVMNPQPAANDIMFPQPVNDVIHRTRRGSRSRTAPATSYAASSTMSESSQFKYKYISSTGEVFDQGGPGLLQIAATLNITDAAFATGIAIIQRMTRNMPPDVFTQLAKNGSVGLFTAGDKTTIFPEYAVNRDRPECKGICNGSCSETCTIDGRKIDTLTGLGGSRGTCLDENFMCTFKDPYYKQNSILVHEFSHTTQDYGLPGISDYVAKIKNAWLNAKTNSIWNVSSYAMCNEKEYFAESSGVWFNANRSPNSNGGMNSCGKSQGFCSNETEARAWLQKKDPQLFDVLSFTYTNLRPTIPGNLSVCVIP